MATVGEILKKERLDQGLLLKDIEKKIKVREKYLAALESNNWNYFSSKIYIVGILKNYARVLNLDSKRVLAFFRRDYERKEEVKFKERISSHYLISGSKRLFQALVILSFLLFLIYFGYQLRLYFSPPKLILISPTVTSFKTEKRVKVIGRTEKDAIVSVVGQRIYLKEDGTFEYDLPLHEGENKVTFELIGANGRKATVEKTFTKVSPK